VEFIFSTAPELAGRIRSFSTVSTSKGDSMLPGKNAEMQVSYSKDTFDGYWSRLKRLIAHESCKDPYSGLRIAAVFFII
jgi:hypothetical protein